MRRKQAYEALHPETKHGGDRKSNQVAKSATRSFADDQATKTGQSTRTVRQDAERGEKIGEDILGMIAGTHLDSGAYMDGIKGLTGIEQRAKVAADLDKHRRDAEAEFPGTKHGGDRRSSCHNGDLVEADRYSTKDE